MNEENQTTQCEVTVKYVTPYPKKALLQLSRGVLTGRYFLFHHCTLAGNAVLDAATYSSYTNSDQSLGILLDYIIPGSGNNSFIHIASYGRGGIFVNFMTPSTKYVKKNGNNFHISPPISTYPMSNCLFLRFLSMYNNIMFKQNGTVKQKYTFI